MRLFRGFFNAVFLLLVIVCTWVQISLLRFFHARKLSAYNAFCKVYLDSYSNETGGSDEQREQIEKTAARLE